MYTRIKDILDSRCYGARITFCFWSLLCNAVRLAIFQTVDFFSKSNTSYGEEIFLSNGTLTFSNLIVKILISYIPLQGMLLQVI